MGYSAVAETTGLKAKDVKGVMEGIVAVAAGELKKNGAFKLAGALNLKLKKKPATPAKRGEPLHKGTMRLQSQACVEDRQGAANEEVQGDGELESACCEIENLGRGGRTRQAYY